MPSSFGPNLLSLELIIVCDCMFPSTVFSLAFKERKKEGGREGGRGMEWLIEVAFEVSLLRFLKSWVPMTNNITPICSLYATEYRLWCPLLTIKGQ